MWIALSCRFEQLPGRVDPDCGHTGRLEHSAEAALATTNIEGGPKPAGCDAAEHDGIQHMLPRPIARSPTESIHACAERSHPLSMMRHVSKCAAFLE
jgi:hypothetical protein